MKKLVYLLLSIFLCTFLAVPAVTIATPVELIDNGDFETGNFDGWDMSLNSTVVDASAPEYGTYSAALSLSQIGTFWGFTYDTNPLSALLVQELEGFETTDQIFTGSIDYNVETLRNWGAGTDDLYFGYLAVNSSIPTFLLGGALVASGDSGGWQNFTGSVDLSGETFDKLYAGIFFKDGLLARGSIDVSSAFIDNVSVTANSAPVPEPATIFLSGLGLLSMGTYLRKRKTKKA